MVCKCLSTKGFNNELFFITHDAFFLKIIKFKNRCNNRKFCFKDKTNLEILNKNIKRIIKFIIVDLVNMELYFIFSKHDIKLFNSYQI